MSSFTKFSAISEIDSKGRIYIPRKVRAKLNLIEGSRVGLEVKNGKLLIYPLSIGRDGVGVSTGVCGTPGPGSNPGPGQRFISSSIAKNRKRWLVWKPLP